MTGMRHIIMSALACALVLALLQAPASSAEGASYLQDNSGSKVKQRSGSGGQKKRTSGGGGLSGKVGDVRHGVKFLEGMIGGCKGAYDQYVRASGHSAYASTPMYVWDAFHCGTGINAGSQRAAEKTALESCERAKRRYKLVTGPCIVYMSK
jgi:hypothetical protein